uniref:Uncharacterized protein n=1 Tax=Cereibacter sphaeroides (strain ATCC 17025 / ATH 2.4.3) TaxID=349102 RepID=A4X014_CERS5
MREEAGCYLGEVRQAMGTTQGRLINDRTLMGCLAAAQHETERLLGGAAGAEARTLHALGFALDEIRGALLHLGRSVECRP